MKAKLHSRHFGLPMNRPKLSNNLLFHMRQKVVLIGSWSQCAAEMAWRLPMNLQEHRTSKEHLNFRSLRHSMLDVGCWMFDVAHWFRGSMGEKFRKILSPRERAGVRGKRRAQYFPASTSLPRLPPLLSPFSPPLRGTSLPVSTRILYPYSNGVVPDVIIRAN